MKAKHWSGRIPRASDARFYHDEQGESLVGVIMAVAISGIAAAGVSAAVGHVMQSQNELKSSQSMNKFQDSLRSSVSTVARTFATTGCGTVACNPTSSDPLFNSICTALGGTSAGGTPGAGNTPSLASSYSSIFSSSNLSLSGLGASLSYTTSITPPTSPYISSNDGAMGQAAARCSTPIKGGALGSGEYYRFCLNVNRSSNSTISSDSYWNTVGSNSSSFIELMMIPVSLPSDKPISCATFQASKQNGLKVLYTVWRHKPIKASASSPFDIKHEDGLFYVGR